ncbi:hypothetical protein ACLB2K_011501 [Fragaria x ananassa]
MILLNDYDGFSDIMAVPLDFVWIWVEIQGIRFSLVNIVQITFKYEHLVGRCRVCMMINYCGLCCPRELEEFEAASKPTAPPAMEFHASATTFLASLSISSVTLPKEKRTVNIREVPEFPSPTKITGVRRSREEEEREDDKRLRHALALVP